ncbi:hypothetical protein KO529_04325 [Arenibacter algicola]|uniref:hypothetical protein n=1 Tax=Arenibacter algicola TaxID=616991 RepID=UPI001C0655AF|nr:hypothetical protein [Arenibacter algicola]MBU2904001.1 hypothetical protein [Arenibacter algicola]
MNLFKRYMTVLLRYLVFQFTFFVVFFGNAQNVIRDAVEKANYELWDKFIDKYGIVNDFQGERPTAYDSMLSRPNGFGWWTPIENGAFFTGMYLMAACERAKSTKLDVDKDKVRILVQGLLKLASVSDVPGFISRGLSTDGKTHYPNGSIDQSIPWFYGLYHYLTTDIPTTKEREIIKRKLIEIVDAIRINNWKIPSDGFFTGKSPNNIKENRFLEVPCYLLLLRCMYELTEDISWLNRYKNALNEIPEGGTLIRADICAQGIAYDQDMWGESKSYLWIYVMKQAALVELAKMEKDESVRAKFIQGVKNNRDFVMRFTSTFSNFNNQDQRIFGNKYWRECYTDWYPQLTVDDAFRISNLRNHDEIGQRKAYERTYMTSPLSAVSIIALAGISIDCDLIDEVISHYDYSKLYLAEFFYAELAYYVKSCE